MNIINIKDIILVNWNAKGLKSKKSTLVLFLSQNKIDIACITETHLKDSETFKITRYKIYRNDRKYITTVNTSDGTVAIHFATDKHDLRVISAYNPSNKKY